MIDFKALPFSAQRHIALYAFSARFGVLSFFSRVYIDIIRVASKDFSRFKFKFFV